MRRPPHEGQIRGPFTSTQSTARPGNAGTAPARSRVRALRTRETLVGSAVTSSEWADRTTRSMPSCAGPDPTGEPWPKRAPWHRRCSPRLRHCGSRRPWRATGAAHPLPSPSSGLSRRWPPNSLRCRVYAERQVPCRRGDPTPRGPAEKYRFGSFLAEPRGGLRPRIARGCVRLAAECSSTPRSPALPRTILGSKPTRVLFGRASSTLSHKFVP